VFLAYTADETVYHRFEQHVGFEVYFIIEGHVQLLGKGRRNTVEEAVYGADGEVAVMIDNFEENGLRPLAELFFLEARFGGDGLEHGVRLPLAKEAEGIEHAAFHFIGGIVGKSNGQDMPEIIGRKVLLMLLAERKLEVFLGEGIGFAGAGRGVIDAKSCMHKIRENEGFEFFNKAFSRQYK